jgi:outer membrane protein OmpA-like peptidoglycan-associated protein
MTPATVSIARALLLAPLLALASCASVPFQTGPRQEVVYALGERGATASPITTEMQPACEALRFRAQEYNTADAHQRPLEKLAAEWAGEKNRKYLVTGYAPPSLPPDYARALTERRAHAIRQSLIEMGIEPANLQTAGFGNDFALSSPTSDVVIIYRAD